MWSGAVSESLEAPQDAKTVLCSEPVVQFSQSAADRPQSLYLRRKNRFLDKHKKTEVVKTSKHSALYNSLPC